jgi:serine phosphatase RsbU (regulator of sigma subunit)
MIENMNLFNYFLSNTKNETFLIQRKAVALLYSIFFAYLFLIILIIFMISSNNYKNDLIHIITPSIIIILITFDLFILKFYSFKKAANFLTISITLAISLQLFIVKPQYELGDYTSTFYFIFVVFSFTTLFASPKLFLPIILIITISLIINIIINHQANFLNYEKRFVMVVTYYFLAIALSVLFMYMQNTLFQTALKRSNNDNKRIYNLNKKLFTQNKDLHKIVEKRTEEISKQNNLLISRNKELKQQNEEIISQKEQISIQKDLIKTNFEILEIKQDEIDSAIRYAKTIQTAILPDCNYLKNKFEHFVIHIPKDIVSGDFYWFSHQNTHNTATSFISVSDCTGHGIPGSFMSMLGNSLLDNIINKEKTLEPEKVLSKMNENIIRLLRQQQTKNHDGMDLALIKIVNHLNNPEKIDLYFSGAKRPLLIYSSQKKELIYLRGNSKSVGGYYQVDNPFTAQHSQLNKGDLIYLLTDGYTDQNNSAGKKIGIKKVKDLIIQNFDKSMELQKEIFLNFLNRHKDTEYQRDDITLMCIKL